MGISQHAQISLLRVDINYVTTTDMQRSLDRTSGSITWQVEHFGEPVIFCQISNIFNFLSTLIPRFQKKLTTVHSNVLLMTLLKGNVFYLGWSKSQVVFKTTIFLFHLSLSWLTKHSIILISILLAVFLLLYNFFGHNLRISPKYDMHILQINICILVSNTFDASTCDLPPTLTDVKHRQ